MNHIEDTNKKWWTIDYGCLSANKCMLQCQHSIIIQHRATKQHSKDTSETVGILFTQKQNHSPNCLKSLSLTYQSGCFPFQVPKNLNQPRSRPISTCTKGRGEIDGKPSYPDSPTQPWHSVGKVCFHLREDYVNNMYIQCVPVCAHTHRHTHTPFELGCAGLSHSVVSNSF